MSASLFPFGMRPIWTQTGQVTPKAYQGGIASAYATAVYRGTPVVLTTSGTLNVAANGADMVGVFAGVEYTDSTGRRIYSPSWTASTVATNIIAWVWDDPRIIFEAQVNGSAAQTAIGDQANFSAVAGYTVGAGTAATGISTMALDPTLAGAASQGMLRILDKSLYVDNDWGDAYTIVQVMIARHQYVSNKVAI